MALVKLPHYTSRDLWKATEINLHDNFNREGGYQLSPTCKKDTIKQQRGCHKHILHQKSHVK
jgi:hypothetical protein